MLLNYFTLLTIGSVFLAIILSLFFFINRKGCIQANRMLACLLTIFNLQVFYSFATSAYAFPYFMDWHKPFFLLRQTSLLIGPLTYLSIQI